MSWARRFRIREYLRGSLWFVPLLGALIGAVLGSLEVAYVEGSVDLPSGWTYCLQRRTRLAAMRSWART